MRIPPNVVVLLSVFALGACGGAATPEAKDANAWADFTGKYSTPAESHGTTSSAKEARRDAKSKTTEAKEEAAETTAAPAKKK